LFVQNLTDNRDEIFSYFTYYIFYRFTEEMFPASNTVFKE